MFDFGNSDMARPFLPISKHKIKVTLSLNKDTYNNAKKANLNVSRFCNASLQIYLGYNKRPDRDSNPGHQIDNLGC